MQQIANVKSWGGRQLRFAHHSEALHCDMHFSLYLPPQAEAGPVPIVTWLSGLTCSDENFVQKAGAQQAAARLGIALLAPDTSPRGEGVPDDPEGAWDMGLGAGFYVNATESPWHEHYHMYDYVVQELPTLVAKSQPVDLARHSISGHSMGGHGALTIALRNPGHYRSVSAFSPICSPLHCAWGVKALGAYLGNDRSLWSAHDSCELLRDAQQHVPMLVDQGTADSFLVQQLKTELLIDAVKESDYAATIRMQEGYDHSYFFISSFIDEHLSFHAQHCG
ncbi:MAG: S-formylglutathione hydrolase [Congregibacter sp.]